MHCNIGLNALDRALYTRTLQILGPNAYKALPRPCNAYMLVVGESIQIGSDGRCGEREVVVRL